MIDKANTVPSPCVSNCCLDEEDICLGCFRHIDEITGWYSADTNKRMEILKNTEQRKNVKNTTGTSTP